MIDNNKINTKTDILDLIKKSVPESEHIEFKETLPCGKGKIDSWIKDQSDIGDYAKKRILEEVVAFANAFGGMLIIGIEETKTIPNTAVRINCIPMCEELAERINYVFRDGVEPPLSSLKILGIPINNKSGVLVIKVGRSYNGPHRVKSTRKCTIRRSTRCEDMTMKEIQELTLNIANGQIQLRDILSDRDSRFEQEFGVLSKPNESFGIRITASPLDRAELVDLEISNGKIHEKYALPRLNIRRGMGNTRTFNHLIERLTGIYQPKLRGARQNDRHILKGSVEALTYAELYRNGLLEIGFVTIAGLYNAHSFNPDFIVGLFAQMITWIKNIQDNSFSIGLEYAIEVQFYVRNTSVRLGSSGEYVHPVNERFLSDQGIDLLLKNEVFPIYSYDGTNEVVDMIIEFQRDLYNWVGLQTNSSQESISIVKE